MGTNYFGLICQIHLKIGGSSQEEISLGFMSLCLSLILGNNKLGGNFYGGPVLSLSPSIMWCSGGSGGSGSTSSYYQSQKLERPVEHTRSSFWVQRRWFLAKLSRKSGRRAYEKDSSL
ncbi:uncharacterized protein LOC107475758 isoform X3 [Arachis duranensis]|uniref:Uncharacterized protein LOC107475758 isoform X3 n=1 Tax=Arachis duranensis TaxID=130453 RepID=A0A9C6TQ94_ARADU|nr:uncharacterized protein LOC107475758 isoform X3 [Arachis duranensis]